MSFEKQHGDRDAIEEAGPFSGRCLGDVFLVVRSFFFFFFFFFLNLLFPFFFFWGGGREHFFLRRGGEGCTCLVFGVSTIFLVLELGPYFWSFGRMFLNILLSVWRLGFYSIQFVSVVFFV